MLIQSYQPKWKNDFNSIKEILSTSLENINISIEHVGSTAVPNLSAKAIIDIDLVYYAQEDFEKIKQKFEAIGYYHNGNQSIIDRDVFKRKPTVEKYEILDSIKHHLYVCPSESEELKRHILFRDFLRKNEEARKKYQEIKQQIAKEANQDHKKYAFIKEVKARDFIHSILEKAE